MIKPNWEIFKAKFNENHQSNFEWFCYLLFCREFNQPYGIFRYKNQAAIETEPININDEAIGWQAKFYDTSLSKNSKKLLDTIEKAKKDYPGLTRLLFYTNQEWKQTSKNTKPQGLLDTEKKANELGIVLEWRTASFFESEFVSANNEIFSKHFFSFDKSIFDVVEEQQKHTDTILSQIQIGINYKGQCLEIDREKQFKELNNQSRQISIISGTGGVGKTVLIKKLYEQTKDKNPFYVFKATEFELRNINDLFGDFSFDNFIEAHKNYVNKTIVIDSSERLIDLNNKDPFKEFLSVLVSDEWQVIFTTRNNYLEDLNYQFFEIYHIAPLNISVGILELQELSAVSEQYSFVLPRDEKLLELIRTPFYLGEYLKYNNESSELDYGNFKANLWAKKIVKSKPAREIYFLKIAFERASSGQFFITPGCESNILDEFVEDGILGYEKTGYFITHDIYEEWSLEQKIEIDFIKRLDEIDFFINIGQSLPVRRSFRNWLSEKLLLEDGEIKKFIENVMGNKDIESFWKDEILVSVLLSNYSSVFFNLFKNELLSNNQELLKRITFILRIACKEVDDFFGELGFKNINLFSLKHVLTKPRGQGWESLIKFVFDNIEAIGIKNVNFILPVVYEWNSKVKDGETTKIASLIALQYYQWIIKEDVYLSRDDTKDKLLRTILYGASEIQDELRCIFEEILKNGWKNHRDPYYELSETILKKLEGISIVKVVPEYILKLADLFWFSASDDNVDMPYYRSSIEIEQYFGLDSHRGDYFPASAYQTPIYWLLRLDLKKTVDFILSFTNKSVRKYAESGFDNFVESVEVHIDDVNTKKQYVSHCLWNMYRGTSSPVSPYLLQSIHMALEKYFLEVGKLVDSNVLESWLIYLLENSESASISSVVTSIVLAYPDKSFNVAKILFQTKDFIIHDTARLFGESGVESLYSIGRNWGANQNEFYDNERIETCKDKHRKTSLENLFLNYQCFRNESINEAEVKKRQDALWTILDNYYAMLPKKSKQKESDKTWRLYLSRMDRRKMDVKTERVENGIMIQFDPKIEPDLEEYSKKALAKSSEPLKYASLKMWAEYKFKNDEKSKQYEQYQNGIGLAIKQAMDIVNKLSEIKAPSHVEMFDTQNESASFYLFNHSTPAYVCAVALRDYLEELDEDEKNFCKDVIFEVSISSLRPDYMYQISDGVQQAIASLPILLDIFPEDKRDIKTILLLNLFNEYHVGGVFQDESFSIFSTLAIRNMWEKYFDDAQSLLLGYLLLKPKYNDLIQKKRMEYRRNNIYNHDDSSLLENFLEANEDNLESIIECTLKLGSIKNLDKTDLTTLKTAFLLIPHKTDNIEHKKIVQTISSVFASKMLNDKDERTDYKVRHDFLRTYAFFILTLQTKEITAHIKPFIDGFNSSEAIADLLREFILAEDALSAYDNFWFVWESFKEKIFILCKDGDHYSYIKEIIESYLFARTPWNESAKSWHSFKDKDKKFFKEVSDRIGHCPSTLYAVSKLLNNIGSQYIDDGIDWIFNIISSDNDYVNKKLATDTIYYMENFSRVYIFNNREKIKKTKALKNKIITILDFLITKGSVVGYMLRESVL